MTQQERHSFEDFVSEYGPHIKKIPQIYALLLGGLSDDGVASKGLVERMNEYESEQKQHKSEELRWRLLIGSLMIGTFVTVIVDTLFH